MAVRDCGKSFSKSEQVAKAAESYENIYARDLMYFFIEECDHQPPVWLSKHVMGKTSLSKEGEPFEYILLVTHANINLPNSHTTSYRKVELLGGIVCVFYRP